MGHSVLFIILTFFFVVKTSFSNETVSPSSEKLETLKIIEKNRKWFNHSLAEKQAQLDEKGHSDDVRKDIIKDIELLRKKINFESHQFTEVASGLLIERDQERNKTKKRDFSKQIKEILMPLLDGIKRISDRPRKIENLYFEIEKLKKDWTLRVQAILTIQKLIEKESFKIILSPLERAKKKLEKEKKDFEFEIEIRKRSLRNIEGEKKSFINEASQLVVNFFGTRGKNLFFAGLILFFSFWSFMVFRNRLFALLNLSQKFLFLKKTFMALYGGISLTLSLFFAILCLYFLNDWLLVTLACVLILGILWSLKQVAPQLLDEARLILNLGTVREGEKVIFKGVPWKVETLNFLTSLTNSSLSGGSVLVRAKDMMTYHSRPWHAEEKWFPTEKGDWVILPEQKFGKILIQTPDQVVVESLGGGQVFYKTEAFLDLTFENLSRGFSVQIVLRLDYKYQKDIVGLIPFFKEGLGEKIRGYGLFKGHIKNVMVEFNSLGDHALDLWIRVDALGTIAQERFTLERFIQMAFIEVCNEKEMFIPFEQLSVHINSSKDKVS